MSTDSHSPSFSSYPTKATKNDFPTLYSPEKKSAVALKRPPLYLGADTANSITSAFLSSPSTLDKGCSSTYSNLEMTFYWNYRIVKKVFVIN